MKAIWTALAITGHVIGSALLLILAPILGLILVLSMCSNVAWNLVRRARGLPPLTW